ncbi:Crp/Fnr family transcriptional regulator [Cognatishimia sp. F0-27]|uniref:Crp/Fnr family transcriptional regulator n=1 Tax=Cognatishimia sp. F0-27 TaxID=2816855 RepID=UPI001D0C960A|nr:Crp/Fnr family transcriptional regulator [Cognatishimia sp. F0-27]MCC1491921.1 Crp/Fnr family transcriptional regulator [Cognatishimia sp. F0-27]
MTAQPQQEQSFSFLFDPSDEGGRLAANSIRRMRLHSGEALFDQGDFDDRLYIVDSGLLEVSVLSSSGRKLALNRLKPGHVFGEIALLDPGPRTARVEAVKPSELRAIKQSALLTAIAHDPALAKELLGLAGQRLRWMSQQVEDQVFLAPAARLASKLVFLMGDGRDVSMSQAQLADFVGVTREVVSKTLSEWRREGIVELARGRITVRDLEALLEIKDADFV